MRFNDPNALVQGQAIGGMDFAQAKLQAAKTLTVGDQMDTVLKRLHLLAQSLESASERISGPMLQDIETGEKPDRPATSIASRLRDMLEWLGRAEQAAHRINESI